MRIILVTGKYIQDFVFRSSMKDGFDLTIRLKIVWLKVMCSVCLENIENLKVSSWNKKELSNIKYNSENCVD
jgi:hypothetical protein